MSGMWGLKAFRKENFLSFVLSVAQFFTKKNKTRQNNKHKLVQSQVLSCFTPSRYTSVVYHLPVALQSAALGLLQLAGLSAAMSWNKCFLGPHWHCSLTCRSPEIFLVVGGFGWISHYFLPLYNWEQDFDCAWIFTGNTEQLLKSNFNLSSSVWI